MLKLVTMLVASYVDYRAVKKEFKELEIIIKNVDAILEMPTESPEKTLDISK